MAPMPAARNPGNPILVYGWVSTNCGRGTSDILWSCLSTIFLCVWTVVHMPIPEYRAERSVSIRSKFIGSRLVPALISFIAPELILITAIIEAMNAQDYKNMIEETVKGPSSLAHGFLLTMGGFCVKTPEGRFHQLDGTDFTAVNESRTAVILTERGKMLLNDMNKIPEEDIKALSKSDTLAKCVACGQGLWLVTQVVSRLFQHQAVTLLEVTTTGYVFCAVGAYMAWWKKPQGCSVPIVLPCSDASTAFGSNRGYETHLGTWREFLWAGREWTEIFRYNSIRDSKYVLQRGKRINGLIILGLATFGAIHCASWNVTLPSSIELWLWRISALWCVVYPIMFVTSMDRLSYGSQYVLPVLYVIVRLYMIVEVFISFRLLPESAYDSVQWSSFIPHV